jgi:hypothetical protein
MPASNSREFPYRLRCGGGFKSFMIHSALCSLPGFHGCPTKRQRNTNAGDLSRVKCPAIHENPNEFHGGRIWNPPMRSCFSFRGLFCCSSLILYARCECLLRADGFLSSSGRGLSRRRSGCDVVVGPACNGVAALGSIGGSPASWGRRGGPPCAGSRP